MLEQRAQAVLLDSGGAMATTQQPLNPYIAGRTVGGERGFFGHQDTKIVALFYVATFPKRKRAHQTEGRQAALLVSSLKIQSHHLEQDKANQASS